MRTAYVRWQAVLDAFRGGRPERTLTPAEPEARTPVQQPDPPAPLPSREPRDEPAGVREDLEREHRGR